MRKHLLRVLTILAVVCLGVGVLAACGDNSEPPEDPTYTLTYDLNGGSGTAPTGGSYKAGATVTIASGEGLSKTDYTLDGWLDGTTKVAAGSSYTMPAHAVTLKANWVEDVTPATYTVTYSLGEHAASGAQVPTQDPVTAGTSITLPAAPDAASGWVFDGWYVDATKAGDALGSYQVNDNVTITAHWAPDTTPATYTVTYLLGDHAVSDAPVPTHAPVTAGTSITLPAAPVAASGWIFAGWYVDETKVGDAFDSYQVNDNVTIIAHWEPEPVETFTLTWLAGDAENASGIPQAAEYGEGDTVTIPADPTCSGYVFNGWRAEHLYVYGDGPDDSYWTELYGNQGMMYRYFHDTTDKENDPYTTYSSTFTMPGEEIHMVAQWASSITFSYNFGDGYEGTTPVYQPDSVAEYSEYTLKDAPVWDGHYFVYWNGGAEGGIHPAGDSITAMASCTFTAVWTTEAQFTIKFSVKDSVLDGFDITVNPGETLAGKTIPSERDMSLEENESFSYWTLNGAQINDLSSWYPTASCTLVAHIETHEVVDPDAAPFTLTFYADEDKSDSFVATADDLKIEYDLSEEGIWYVKWFTDDHRFQGDHAGQPAGGWYGYSDPWGTGLERSDLVEEDGWASLEPFADWSSGWEPTWPDAIELFADWSEGVAPEIQLYSDTEDNWSSATSLSSDSVVPTRNDAHHWQITLPGKDNLPADAVAPDGKEFGYWFYLIDIDDDPYIGTKKVEKSTIDLSVDTSDCISAPDTYKFYIKWQDASTEPEQTPPTIIFDKGSATGTDPVDVEPHLDGDTYTITLPENPYTAPAGTYFRGWEINEVVFYPSEQYSNIAEGSELTVKAIWSPIVEARTDVDPVLGVWGKVFPGGYLLTEGHPIVLTGGYESFTRTDDKGETYIFGYLVELLSTKSYFVRHDTVALEGADWTWGPFEGYTVTGNESLDISAFNDARLDGITRITISLTGTTIEVKFEVFAKNDTEFANAQYTITHTIANSGSTSYEVRLFTDQGVAKDVTVSHYAKISDKQELAEGEKLEIGNAEHTLGYTGITPVWTSSLMKGEKLVMSGTMTSVNVAPDNFRTAIAYLYSRNTTNRSVFRSDNFIVDGKLDDDASKDDANGANLSAAENWATIGRTFTNSAEGDFWTLARDTFNDCDVTFTFEYTKTGTITMKLEFASETNTFTMTWTITAAEGKTLQNLYTIGLGGESCHIQIDSIVRSSAHE